MARINNAVFLNCPFDDGYQPIFDAVVFAIYDLGFKARCALEVDDSGETRIAKIERLIEQCRYGIHDISAVELDPVNGLPRFNMPLELGLFFGCKRFGSKAQKRKVSLILDAERYRYQKFISDLSGHDVREHRNDPVRAITIVRNWLATHSARTLPGGPGVANRYVRFIADLPGLCMAASLEQSSLTFIDLSNLIVNWLRTSR